MAKDSELQLQGLRHQWLQPSKGEWRRKTYEALWDMPRDEILSGISSDILSDIPSDILCDISSDI